MRIDTESVSRFVCSQDRHEVRYVVCHNL
jgi:hypothetical protein